MFNEILQSIMEETPGGVGAVIMGFDGIPIAQQFKQIDDVDLHLVAVEYANILKEVRNAVEVLNTGEMEEVSIKTSRFYVIVRPLTPDYFIALTIERDGNFGKGRYLLLRDRDRLREALL